MGIAVENKKPTQSDLAHEQRLLNFQKTYMVTLVHTGTWPTFFEPSTARMLLDIFNGAAILYCRDILGDFSSGIVIAMGSRNKEEVKGNYLNLRRNLEDVYRFVSLNYIAVRTDKKAACKAYLVLMAYLKAIRPSLFTKVFTDTLSHSDNVLLSTTKLY